MPLADKPVVGAGGGVYVAPFGTPTPTAFTAFTTDPWDYLGFINEDGLSWTPPEEETEDMNVWQLQFPWDVVTTGMSTSFGFALAQWSRDTLSFALGGGTWTEAAPVAPATTGTLTFTPPAIDQAADERAVALRISTSSGFDMAVIFPRAKVTEREEVTFNKGEMSTLGVTVTMLGQEDVPPYSLLFEPGALPAGA